MTAESNEAYEKILCANLQRTLDFLRYAEAKNGALLTLVSAWASMFMVVLAKNDQVSPRIQSSLSAAIPFLAGAAALSIVSFIPITSLKRLLRGSRTDQESRPNLCFFGDVGRLSLEEFNVSMKEFYYPGAGNAQRDEYRYDLIVQIWINSRITARKLVLFTWGTYMVGAAFVILLVRLILF